MIHTKMMDCFRTIFNDTETPRFFFAPGRVNLIGEHTDYNGGHVFPIAISYGTYALVQMREDKELHLYSMNFSEKGTIKFDLSNLNFNETHNWANFPKGMIKFFKDDGFNVNHGMNILYYGNIPNSSGLSSSASLEMVTGVMLEHLFNFNINRLQIIQIAQKVENKFIGVNSGIMDQFIIGKGIADHAMLLNTETLQYHHAPIKLDNHLIVIINTNKHRALVDSKYNERRTECEQALIDLQSVLPIKHLCQLTVKEFEAHKYLISNEITRKRAKHVVYENERTKLAYKELQQNNLAVFGELMNESHKSLQHDYEVTGTELDTIVQTAWEQPGVIGSRMTGAGFGGCAIAIVEKETIEIFKKNITFAYQNKIGYKPSFYLADIGDGAKEIIKDEF